ncbi:apolipoprotein L4-like [Limulus polyphemus]|uniref:Apolipoprotein L4-like n=1 Tax=Limulus polyphemus TaxID=6850 RepID=A0ABM1BF53_LIMPO|nr:apolipoprotein L4-like [Limulus polyphemus]
MKKFHEELKKILMEDERARAHFIDAFPIWITTRNKSIKSLKKINTELNESRLGVNISNIVGSSVGIVGGSMAIVGLVLAPVTAGLSLGLTIGGASLGAAGGLTAGGANVTELIINKNKCQEIKETLDKDKKESDELFKYMKTLKRCDNNREKLLIEAKEFIDIVENGVNTGKSLMGQLGKVVEFLQNLANLEEVTLENAKKVFEKTFMNSPANSTRERNTLSDRAGDLNLLSNLIVQGFSQGGKFSKLALAAPTLPRAVPIVLGAVVIALDVVNLVLTSVNIHNGNRNELQNRIGEVIQEITVEKEEIVKVHEHITA